VAWKPDYITAAQAKAHLRIDDAVDDTELGVWITAASRAIDDATNRQFGQLGVAAARTYRRPPAYDVTTGLYLVEIDDVQDTTGMLVDGTAVDQVATLLPDNAPADGRPYERLGFDYRPTMPVVVTAVWGWDAVPTQVVGACKLQVARFHARRDSPYGIAGSPDTGSEMRLLARLDPDVRVALAGLARFRLPG